MTAPRRPRRPFDDIDAAAAELLARLGHGPATPEGRSAEGAARRDGATTAAGIEERLAAEMIRTAVKLLRDGADVGQLKLVSAAMKEMRHAYRIFGRYRERRKISIFGSARTPPDHPDYAAAREFGRLIAQAGWMAITGAGQGIMQAGHEGPQRDASFGLSIRLPFETTANEVIEGDPKHISFRYFFTRKLMFLSHSDAVAVFPGGFGTHDELFEALTLVQTGKSGIVPIVLIEGHHADGPRGYWPDWNSFVADHLLSNGWISPEDLRLYHIAASVDDAVAHVLRFYRRFHSSRYVNDRLVLRLREPLAPAQVAALDAEFAPLVESGRFEQGAALPEETDHLGLPRLHFHHTRRQYGLVRALIDRVNSF
ncbi:MAG: LOG family protein [Phycisphaerales bacterium]